MNFPEGFHYTESHEWARMEGDEVLVGITDFAQNELGDIVYVELPDIDDVLEGGEECGMIDSAKTTSPINNPVSGRVTRINEQLVDHPELLNKSPYDEGWLYALEPDSMDDLAALMDKADYEKFIEES
ncbi:MAG: glycine cleavage system protein GcvH [bacterium]|nr:glycine cleavage system protein GcvH [bacterium]